MQKGGVLDRMIDGEKSYLARGFDQGIAESLLPLLSLLSQRPHDAYSDTGILNGVVVTGCLCGLFSTIQHPKQSQMPSRFHKITVCSFHKDLDFSLASLQALNRSLTDFCDGNMVSASVERVGNLWKKT